MRHLLTDNHEDRRQQRKHIRRAIEIYRALLAGGVVERLDEPGRAGRYVRLTVDLQYDFALNQPLSPFALAAIELLDRRVATATRWTCFRSSSPPWTTRARSCPRSSSGPAARRSPR